jgi:hypothetical protein
VRDCVAVGFSLTDIRGAGYSAVEARDDWPGLFTPDELAAAGYPRAEPSRSSDGVGGL